MSSRLSSPASPRRRSQSLGSNGLESLTQDRTASPEDLIDPALDVEQTPSIRPHHSQSPSVIASPLPPAITNTTPSIEDLLQRVLTQVDKLAEEVVELKKEKETRHPTILKRTIRSVTPVLPDEDPNSSSSSEASLVGFKLKGRHADSNFNSSDSDSIQSEAAAVILKPTSKVTKKRDDIQKIRLRADDLPKYYGNKDDVETWIQTVSAIWESSGVPEASLLSILPLLLKGKASKWYVSLGKDRRELRTWKKWKAAFRKRWLTANYDAKLKKKGIYR